LLNIPFLFQPEYVVCALLLLCQRKGLLSDLQLPVLKTTADYSTPAAPDALTWLAKLQKYR
jgi:hypothetical protein